MKERERRRRRPSFDTGRKKEDRRSVSRSAGLRNIIFVYNVSPFCTPPPPASRGEGKLEGEGRRDPGDTKKKKKKRRDGEGSVVPSSRDSILESYETGYSAIPRVTI